MLLDRALRKTQPVGDLHIRKARNHQGNDLAFPMREGRVIETVAKWTRYRELPEGDRPHGSTQHAVHLAIEHQRVRAHGQQGSHLASGGGRDDDDDSRIRRSAPSPPGRSTPARRGLAIHDEDDVGAGGESLDGGRPGAEVLGLDVSPCCSRAASAAPATDSPEATEAIESAAWSSCLSEHISRCHRTRHVGDTRTRSASLTAYSAPCGAACGAACGPGGGGRSHRDQRADGCAACAVMTGVDGGLGLTEALRHLPRREAKRPRAGAGRRAERCSAL